MLITPYNSQKIRVLSLVLIVQVLYIHSFYLEAMDYPFALGLQKLTGNNGIACVAVPMFFMISGLLFFNGIETLSHCLLKQKKRVRTLLVPYLFWNVIFVLWYVILQNISGLEQFINSDMIDKVFEDSVIMGAKEMFWEPAAFHLWFLRDLIVIVLFVPILYFLIKYIKWLTPLVLFLAMMLLLHVGFFSIIDYELNRIDGIVFFSIGGCVSMHGSLEQVNKWLTKPIWGLAALLYFGNAVWHLYRSNFNEYFNFVTALCGCIVAWKGYDYFSFTNKSLHNLLGYSFFIYLFHEPAINTIKKLGLMLLGVNEWSLIVLYLLNPIIMCFAAITIAKTLEKYVPKLYSVLVGGR